MDKKEIQERQGIALNKRDRAVRQGNLFSCGPYIANYCLMFSGETQNTKAYDTLRKALTEGF